MFAPVRILRRMSASKKPRRSLTYYPINKHEGVMRLTLQKGKSWQNKLEQLTRFIDSMKQDVRACHDVEELEKLEFSLGGLEAAAMVCKNHIQLEYSTSALLIKIFAEQAECLPIGFCRLFWLLENPKGQRHTILRGPLVEIEQALAKNSKSTSAVYQMSKVLHYMLGYSHYADGNPDLEAIAAMTLSKMLHANMIPHFGAVPELPRKERDVQIKALRNDLLAAFDLAAKSSTKIAHGSAETIEWIDGRDGIVTVLPAWAAIQYARRLLEKMGRIPTKAEVRQTMVESHSELKQNDRGFWSKVWCEAGLECLPKGKPVIAKAKGQIDKVRKFTKNARKR